MRRNLISSRNGLSPPTRGNPRISPRRAAVSRSIPAHAGEPPPPPDTASSPEVYPRPRGGTARRRPPPPSKRGLSPPTRGNHCGVSRVIVRHRSIPAHAGEPETHSRNRARLWVYPRPRGGTGNPLRDSPACGGLSPPTRGNRGFLGDFLGYLGSIPAHAGEPGWTAAGWTAAGVYPRPRGGTRGCARLPRCARGLSPPTRGNRTLTQNANR